MRESVFNGAAVRFKLNGGCGSDTELICNIIQIVRSYKTWGFTTYVDIRICNEFVILMDNPRNIREVMEIICNFI